MWQIRIASFLPLGVDLREEMDPATHAYPPPLDFWSVLEQLGYNLTGAIYIVAESHARATSIFNYMAEDVIGKPADVLVNFDAHHDLGYCDWARLQGMLDREMCTCDMWLCALMDRWPDLEARIVFPDWLREEDTIRQQSLRIREILPDDIYTRVKIGFFSMKRGDVINVVAKPTEQLDVQCVFVCRSGSWVPPWLDEAFVDFVRAGSRVIDHLPSDPFRHKDISPLDIRNFDYNAAVNMAEQFNQLRSR